MRIENVELTEQEVTDLLEACATYDNSMKVLKFKGVKYPERAAKKAIKEIEENVKVIEETIAPISPDQFSSYFNEGNAYGASFDEIKEAYDKKDTSFLIESSFFNGITQRVTSLKNMGHKIHNLSVTTRGGVPHAEFLSTDKNNNRIRHIVHGNSSTTANLGKVAPSQDPREDQSI